VGFLGRIFLTRSFIRAGIIAGLIFFSVPGWSESADQGSSAHQNASGDTDASKSASQNEFAQRAAGSLARGVECISRLDPSPNGDAFVAVQLRAIYPEPGLDRFIERSRRLYPEDCGAWYITPDRPLVKLPDPMPVGLARWGWVMHTPHAEPKYLAKAVLREYLLTENCSGYILTHQMMIFEIAKSRGMALPPEILDRRAHLLGAIHEEQRVDQNFGDLFAERAMVLLLYGSPTELEARHWIETIITAQRPDGSWKDDRVYSFDYQGDHGTGRNEIPHTCVLSAFATALYLLRFGGSSLSK